MITISLLVLYNILDLVVTKIDNIFMKLSNIFLQANTPPEVCDEYFIIPSFYCI